MHKHCSGLNSRLGNDINFKCRTCLKPTVTNDDDKKVGLSNVEYKIVDQFVILVTCSVDVQVQRQVQ